MTDASALLRRLRAAESDALSLVGALVDAKQQIEHAVDAGARDAAVAACMRRAELALNRANVRMRECWVLASPAFVPNQPAEVRAKEPRVASDDGIAEGAGEHEGTIASLGHPPVSQGPWPT